MLRWLQKAWPRIKKKRSFVEKKKSNRGETAQCRLEERDHPSLRQSNRSPRMGEHWFWPWKCGHQCPDSGIKILQTQLKARKCAQGQGKKFQHKERSQSLNKTEPEPTTKSYIKKSRKHYSKQSWAAESRPAAQIAPKSLLGAALRNIGRSQKPRQPSESPSYSYSSSSSSESSECSSNPSDRESSDSSDDDSSGSEWGHWKSRQHHNNCHGRHKCRRHASSSSSRRTTIKPIPFKEYDGDANVLAYHHFVQESDAYLQDGKVRGHWKVFLLLYYLMGKAYDFHIQKVAIDKERWTVSQFYEELFNFCFLVDYRMQLHKNKARCHQNDKSVAKYTHELQDLFHMIGNIPKQD